MRLVVVAASRTIAGTITGMAARMAAANSQRGIETDVCIDVYHGTIDAFVRTHPGLAGRSAVASPGNLLGLMNGGYDRHLCEALGGGQLADALHRYFIGNGGGYAPVGTARSAPLKQICSNYSSAEALSRHGIDTLILAVTMVVPERLQDLRVVFDCVWNTFMEARVQGVENVVMPMFGTGYGGVDPETAARLTLGAAFLFYMRIPPLVKAAAVVQFLGKDVLLFGNEEELQAAIGHGEENHMAWEDLVTRMNI